VVHGGRGGARRLVGARPVAAARRVALVAEPVEGKTTTIDFALESTAK